MLSANYENMRKKFKCLIIFAIMLCTAIFGNCCYASVIAINAGHQLHANLEKEELGAGSDILKNKVSQGTRGIISQIPEYELNLQIAKLLEQELQKRGQQTIMLRTENDVNISNKERVEKAVAGGADLIISLHANAPGKNQPKNMHGIMTLCRSHKNKFNASLYPKERKLAQCIQTKLCEKTGAANLGLFETDGMTTINWSPVPSVIVEVGYMTNAEEDQKLQSETYRKTIAAAIADGIEEYLKLK